MKWTIALGLLAGNAAASTGPNPIRKVVTLLQKMHKEIDEEGEKEAELQKKMKCYCKENEEKMAAASAEAVAEAERLAAAVKEKTARKEQTAAELKEHKKDRAQAKEDLAKATEIRKKEAAEYEKVTADSQEDIDACTSAITALEKGMGSTAFLQAPFYSALKKAVNGFKGDSVDFADRDSVISFLENSADYAPQSGQIVGILKNMLDEMDKDLGGVMDAEKAAVAAFAELKAAKEKEIAAASSAIEAKTELVGKLALEVANDSNEAEDQGDKQADAAKLAAQLKEMCEGKAGEYEEHVKIRNEELAAIGETIAFLNSDEALDIMKAAPGTSKGGKSFLQRASKKNNALSKARTIFLSMSSKKSNSKAFSLLASTAALRAKSTEKSGKGFDKVVTMITDMVALLKKEQKDDEEQRDWCNKEIQSSKDTMKDLSHELEVTKSQIADAESDIAAAEEQLEIQAKQIVDLDKAAAEATEQRKEEHEEALEAIQLNQAAVKLIGKAKNRLQKFYNPGLYEAPQRRELTREEKQAMAAGGEDPRIAEEAEAARKEKMATGMTAFVQVRAHEQAPDEELSLGEAPETMEYKKKGQKSNAIMAMMDALTKDLEKDIMEEEMTEKASQAAYEKLMADTTKDKEETTKAMNDLKASKAEAEEGLIVNKDKATTTAGDLNKTHEYMTELHAKCDFILEQFDFRREARTSEIEGLKNAKAVLAGADYE